MKILSIILFILLGISGLNAQTHHFNNTSTTLIKTTDESPAHWYIEIFNDVAVDTTLRWKCFFENVPTQWQITFDDQDNFYPNVSDGDSADFTLMAAPQFPQKLIIGAILNNTPASATVHFEIYNPIIPNIKDTISYIFIISQGNLGLDDFKNKNVAQFTEQYLVITNDILTDFLVLDATGRELMQVMQSDKLDLSSLKKGEVFYLSISQGNKRYLVRWMK